MRSQHQRSLVLATALLLTTSLAGGCATSSNTKRPTITTVRNVSRAGGVPQIVKVVDLGAMRLPKRGAFSVPQGDGQGTIGELLLIWGKDFGKQPAVLVGDEPTDVLAHVEGGGVVVRIPWGLPSGAAKITVSTRDGSASLSYPVRRVGLVGDARGLRSFALGKGGVPTLGAPLAISGAVALIPATDGSVAYAAVEKGGKLALVTIDLTASTPRELTRDALPGKRIAGLARASRKHLAVVVTDTHVVYIDTQAATTPALYKAQALPRGLLDRPLGGVALAPKGETLALLARDKNQLVLFDARKPTELPAPQILDALPAARLPMTLQASFSLDGNKLWITAGDNKDSIAAGHQAAQLVAYTLSEGRAKGEPTRWILSETLAPAAASMARSAPTPAGTAIRTQTASSALYAAAHPFELLSKKGSRAQGGAILRAVEGKPVQTLLAGKHVLGAVRVVGRPQTIICVGTRAKGKAFERFLLTQPAWDEQAKPHTASIAPLPSLATPPEPSLLVVQP